MITCADIFWKNDTPYSTGFDDFYFNTEQSFEDSLYVYINANNLPSRLNAVPKRLTIAETGFGTGLNFLLTAQQWLNKSSNGQQLHFISVEKQPLSHNDLKRALHQWKDFEPLSSKLLNQYPLACQGFHRLSFPDERITLTLIFGDALDSYKQLKASIDAWYLDGFSPSKNPEMWSPELFREIARLSKPGTTFSTFTSASVVRRGLQAVGFEVRKQPGFGKKREMSLGTFIENKAPTLDTKPWFSIPKSEQPTEVTIIGGGLSGCSTAYSLAQRGIKVRLIEKEQHLATAGSGNRQGALYAKLPVSPTKQGELHLTGFLHTVNLLKRKDPEQSFWSQCGVAQLATKENEKKRQQELIDNSHYPDSLVQHKSDIELSEISGSVVSSSGLFFPTAGWVSPVDFCHLLAAHPNISIEQHDITNIEQIDHLWNLTTSNSKHLHCSHLIICNAELANQFKQTEHLPLKAIRGQVSITEDSADLPQLRTVVCGEGYISPAQGGKYCFGATFDLKGKQRDVTQYDHNKNLEKLEDALPEFHNALIRKKEPLTGRTAFRCSTPDYMPVVGPAPVFSDYIEAFGRLRKDKNWRFDGICPSHYPNLYVNTGHGSKGLITCPISAELLASMICNEPLPLPKTLIDAVNPARFIIKNLIRRAI
ncbi:bifunctional tRNA (5-methylaminomethyl-2-thiouridine)(34)-methyltransferase MnmD/FAD-dependent 5-carboxymethylaminomethyl-2-thiouridine(34) oxidoreductase MnmC [Neptuniibacter sp. 1_MG-2023]|uniref:bifunctional tRNA (5-methylaminomethyl-2-thiouridine)(34)-methyltransferase MnmD/FAD-dependent 5-carboxymethylaminomethyl-2-thiouridine(34) oxidoreductase MnmC n=1 Tax=Neptuniibacter sp. 1_MG-2023 TaxID=3062662 RepID=UPI0026E362F0|nr:bifunctional tRNA (5-methylaminomethyl-2-thiouridine)(34)-methyltransferase MnmD/FAD-dependent 5-carboxymethylaminomethyl-2-thiouridine(34) oxidoreductase MnmC [Neptuniibacter sp. 1_MG-2023]MDO6592758.1 bifunctional tRNA (5-methylaminomethyl-2-thiouridine)(34)-methyltransferase MnmD/FAD-dependent 5-carboxymethylaminomethyl-2-thiouridine(34) oxidoreductase MnmC [Neptuniibacter sp. 1_MG-2023]